MKHYLFLFFIIVSVTFPSQLISQNADCSSAKVSLISYDDESVRAYLVENELSSSASLSSSHKERLIDENVFRRDSFCANLLMHRYLSINGRNQKDETLNYVYNNEGRLIEIQTHKYENERSILMDTIDFKYEERPSQVDDRSTFEKHIIDAVIDYLVFDYQANPFSKNRSYTLSYEVRSNELKIQKKSIVDGGRYYQGMGYTCTMVDSENVSIVEDDLLRSGFNRGPKEVVLSFDEKDRVIKVARNTNHRQNSTIYVYDDRGRLISTADYRNDQLDREELYSY